MTLSTALAITDQPEGSLGLLALSTFGSLFIQQQQERQRFATLLKMMPSAFRHPVASATYAGDSGLSAQMQVAIRSEQVDLNTVLARIDDAAQTVSKQVIASLEMSEKSFDAMRQQQHETDQVATAVHEMNATINDSLEARTSNGQACRKLEQYCQPGT
ncbi:hypothetical protein GCM10011352_04400 [Marinobacterium zhoushanense]|uniref:Methyl-accepting chemotaxis protein n=1 Tax=Marinobacterium zhoushanense TaxID=1679163 RepID=A0ABQ1K1U2_9GAMM|nr:hypothetical protein [Marinobacterium zhoushanense]GGB81753.1 hypothetical protein GCM10011352_04400 [Marinobacterium zhoushanense]